MLSLIATCLGCQNVQRLNQQMLRREGRKTQFPFKCGGGTVYISSSFLGLMRGVDNGCISNTLDLGLPILMIFLLLPPTLPWLKPAFVIHR